MRWRQPDAPNGCCKQLADEKTAAMGVITKEALNVSQWFVLEGPKDESRKVLNDDFEFQSSVWNWNDKSISPNYRSISETAPAPVGQKTYKLIQIENPELTAYVYDSSLLFLRQSWKLKMDENRALEDQFSVQGGHFPLPWLWEDE